MSDGVDEIDDEHRSLAKGLAEAKSRGDSSDG
jgi:hypothetical protein